MALATSLPQTYPQIKRRILVIGPFKYHVVEFGEYHTLKADHTGEVVEFLTTAAFASFVDALTAHIHDLYPDNTTPDDPRCPNCGRHARRVMPNPLNADQDVCRYCAERNADELAREGREWAYDRVEVGR